MQAQIPVTQLAQPGSRDVGLVALIRKLLFAIFMNASNNKLPDAVSDPALVHMCKLFLGRLLGQLHDRAARTDALPPNAFHETGLQRVSSTKASCHHPL
jgi:hypothetical protein